MLKLSFYPPLDNGGEDVNYYKIEWDITPTCNSNAEAPNKGSVEISALEYNYYTITDLSNTTQYFFRISAANSMGYGPFAVSSPSAATPSLQKIPGAASSVAVFEINGHTYISWAPTNNAMVWPSLQWHR